MFVLNSSTATLVMGMNDNGIQNIKLHDEIFKILSIIAREAIEIYKILDGLSVGCPIQKIIEHEIQLSKNRWLCHWG